jgi:hypothetical protein
MSPSLVGQALAEVVALEEYNGGFHCNRIRFVLHSKTFTLDFVLFLETSSPLI